jgi:phosphoadenosine phosphosulfate reductase
VYRWKQRALFVRQIHKKGIMMSHTYDKETGGILLNNQEVTFSKEPRPVYAKTLDILGFDKHWRYDKQQNSPYMWAEANMYYYRGEFVAKVKGGTLYDAPEIILSADNNIDNLIPVDVKTMVAKNREAIETLEHTTAKRIVNVWKEYKNKLDFFQVCFSGGKDSVVLLDLVKKSLPKDSFTVLFGDTDMEFSDTYSFVEKISKQCKREGIAFYTAKSHMSSKETWNKFAPPSRRVRWCCSVHKSTPQLLKIREITKNNNVTVLSLVGVRAHESFARSKYEFLSYGKKQAGQYSFNPILDWTSAQVWAYIYANSLPINESYKKGQSRVGCIACPMRTGKAAFMEHSNYKDEMTPFISCIIKSNEREHFSAREYVANNGWRARASGKYLRGIERTYEEKTENGVLSIDVKSPKTNWQEWIKTLGNLSSSGKGNYTVTHKGKAVNFTCTPQGSGYVVRLSEGDRTFKKWFRRVFRKAAYCVGCKTCEAFCKNGCISFGGNVKIRECKHCLDCLTVKDGCLAYNSLKLTKDFETRSSDELH